MKKSIFSLTAFFLILLAGFIDLHAQTVSGAIAAAWPVEVRRRKAPSSWTSLRSFTSIHFAQK